MPQLNIKTLPEIRLATVRHIGSYEKSGDTWNTLIAWAGPKGLLNEHTKMMGFGYDDPATVPESELRYDAAITVNDTIEDGGDITIRMFPEQTYATALHKGSYNNFSATINTLWDSVQENGYTWAGSNPLRFHYLNNPYDTKEEDLRTEVYIPIVKK